MLTSVEVAIHQAHHPVKHIARALAARMGVRSPVLLRPPAQFLHLLQPPRRLDLSGCPLPQPPQPLGEAPPIWSVVGVPNLLPQGPEEFPQVLGSLADAQPAVQEAAQPHHQWEQCLPRQPRGCPPVGVDRLRRVVGLDVLGLLLEHPVGCFQVLGAGGLGQGGAQATTRTDGGGHLVLHPVAGLVVLVGHQVLGHLGLADRGADDAGTAQTDFQAIPEHGIVTEDVGQGPEGHAEGTQEQWPGHVLGPGGHVGQDEGRANGEGGAVRLARDAPQAQAAFARDAVVLESVALGEGLGEEFGMRAEGLVQPAAELGGGVDQVLVAVLANGQADRRTTAGLGARTCGHGSPPSLTVFHHGGSWPFLLSCPLCPCSLTPPSPKSGTIRTFVRTTIYPDGPCPLKPFSAPLLRTSVSRFRSPKPPFAACSCLPDMRCLLGRSAICPTRAGSAPRSLAPHNAHSPACSGPGNAPCRCPLAMHLSPTPLRDADSVTPERSRPLAPVAHVLSFHLSPTGTDVPQSWPTPLGSPASETPDQTTPARSCPRNASATPSWPVPRYRRPGPHSPSPRSDKQSPPHPRSPTRCAQTGSGSVPCSV